MKVITASRLCEILRKQWTQLEHIWRFDKKFSLLSSEQVDKILKEIDVYKKQFKNELFDCDDFALVTNAFVKLEVAKLNLSYNWAFGEVAMMHPRIGVHNQNVFITEDFEVKLFEPQANKIILPGKGEIVFYVRI